VWSDCNSCGTVCICRVLFVIELGECILHNFPIGVKLTTVAEFEIVKSQQVQIKSMYQMQKTSF